MLTPDKNEFSVNLMQKWNVWEFEDRYWPILQHPNIIAVTNTMIIDELNVKLCFMPIHPKVLCLTVAGGRFKSDHNNLNRVKNGFHQILAAVEYLHNSDLCHLDIKTDNVLLYQEDNAVLCAFSGLNFEDVSLKRVVAPAVFFFQKNVCQLKVIYRCYLKLFIKIGQKLCA